MENQLTYEDIWGEDNHLHTHECCKCGQVDDCAGGKDCTKEAKIPERYYLCGNCY